VPLRKGDLAVALEGQEELFLSLVLDENHILGRREPDIGQHIAKGYLLVHDRGDHLAGVLVLGSLALPLVFAGLLVRDEFGLLDQREGNGNGGVLAQVQSRQQIDALEGAAASEPSPWRWLVRRRRASSRYRNQAGVYYV
jgi:hypothetical protein